MAKGFLAACSHGGIGEATTGTEIELDFGVLTTGKGFQLDLDLMTTGVGIEIRADSDIMTTGYFLRCLGGTAMATEVLSVADGTNTGQDVVKVTGAGAHTAGYGTLHVLNSAAIAADGAALRVATSGAIASGGNAMRLDVTGTPASGAVYTEFDFAGLTDTNENVGVHIDATSKKVQALKIDAAPLAGSTVLVTSTGVIAADKATLELVSNVATCNADSSVLRVEQTATDGVAHCATVKQDDIDKCFINFEGATAADYSSPISTEQGDGAVEGPKIFSSTAGWLWIGMVRCSVNGVKAYIPYYEEDPS